MTSPLQIAASKVLYAAVAAEVGIVVRTESALRAKAILYRFRQEIGDPILSSIQIRLSPDDPDHELWLIKLGAKSPEPQTLIPSKMELGDPSAEDQ